MHPLSFNCRVRVQSPWPTEIVARKSAKKLYLALKKQRRFIPQTEARQQWGAKRLFVHRNAT